jgi:hypothetical protein
MGKKSRSGSGINIPDHISESLKTIFWVEKYLNSLMWIQIRDPESFDPGSGIRMEKIRIRDPGINIADPQNWCHDITSVGDPDSQYWSQQSWIQS